MNKRIAEQTNVDQFFPATKFKSAKRERGVGIGEDVQKLETVKSRPRAEHINTLSQETEELLTSLPYEPSRPIETVFSELSAHGRFQHLLDPALGLPLPHQYKKLLKLFEGTDSALNYAKIKNIQPLFTYIKQAVETTIQLTFSESTLGQFIHVLPEAYLFKWIKKSFSKNFDLLINLPKTCSAKGWIIQRKSAFRSRLIDITKAFHKRFLDSLPCKPELDFNKLQNWHSAFKLHEVPEIPIEELPPKPEETRIIPMSNLLSKLHPIESSPPLPEESPLCTGVSPHLAMFIRKKEQLRIQQKLTTMDKDTQQKLARVERLTTISEMLKVIYYTQKTPSVFLKSLTKKLADSEKFPNNCEVLETDLLEIITLFPGWLQRIHTNSGPVVRMQRDYIPSKQELEQGIRAKYT